MQWKSRRLDLPPRSPITVPRMRRASRAILGLLLLLLPPGAPPLPAAEPLRVFIWSEYLDPEVVKDFERICNARVTVDVYEEAESLLAKLRTGGTALYDVVVPPDHLVVPMVKLGLLAPLRHDRLPNLEHLDPKFLSPPFDPRNQHTVAYQWGTVGIYYRKSPGRPDPDSWNILFDPDHSLGPWVLIDSMRDAIGAALKYRGHSLNAISTEALREARDLLLAAKPRTVALEGSVGGRNRVLARSAAAAIVYSSDAARGMAEDPETAYVIPREGSQIWLDNLAVPARAPNRDLAERFINHLLDPRVSARNARFTQGATPVSAARAFLPEEDLRHPAIYPPADTLDRLEYLQDLGGRTRLYDQVWTQVKAR